MKHITIVMLVIYVVISSTLLFAEESYRYTADVVIDNSEPLDFVNLASMRFISPSKEKMDSFTISIKDAKGEICEIKKLNKTTEREAEILFVPTKSRFYTAYIKENGAGTIQTDKNLKEGSILIEDFVPTKSTKSGHWNWVASPRMSGCFSLTGKDGISFQRVVFPSPYKINKNDKLILYLYCSQKKPPQEIMVQLTVTRNKNYVFSWGEDKLAIDQTKKIQLGNLPETGRWVKIEIPFTDISENNLNALGLYYSGGQIWWDRISINEVPVKAGIKTLRDNTKEVKAYFNYTISVPFNIAESIFEILTVDASPSLNAESLTLTVAGKTYREKTVELLLMQSADRKISLTAEHKGIKDTMEYEIPKNRQKSQEINIVTKILPYNPFVKDNKPFTAVLSVKNLNDELIPIEIKSRCFEEKTYLRPGETKHIYMNFSGYNTGDTIATEVDISGLKLCEKTFFICSPQTTNINLDGPFLKDDKGNFLIINYPGQNIRTSPTQTKLLNICLAGSYSEETVTMLQNILEDAGITSVISAIGQPVYGNNHRLFSEYIHITKILNTSTSGEIFIFFPYLESIRQKTPIDEWENVVEAIISAAERKFSYIIIASPFPAPPFPEIYEPYKKAAEKIVINRNLELLDIYTLYLSHPDWKKMFTYQQGIYKNLPTDDENHLFIKELAKIIMRLWKSTANNLIIPYDEK